MPLHDYIKQIYKEVGDSSYFIRFIDYLVSNTNRRVTFIVNGYTAEPLISGVLQNIKTKDKYYSFAQFYNKATLGNVGETDTNIFKHINVTTNYTLWRILCNIDEKTILGFFDQKYRSFLMYRDVRQRIKYYTSIDTNKEIKVVWNKYNFIISHTLTKCIEDPNMVYSLFEAYEDGKIQGLFYYTEDNNYLISQT
jgi:hypothetical protein